MLPDYLAKAAPNPMEKRAPWYANTAPSYAGIFLWIAFYRLMAGDTLAHGSLAVCLAGLVAAGLLCYSLYYLAPAMLGMKTGFPLYVVGSSTFGVQGGYLMPGLLMGLLQIGWFAVATSVASEFILKGLGMNSAPGGGPFIATGVIWGCVMAWVGAKGIRYVAKVSLLLNAIPLLMLLIVFLQTAGGIGRYHVPAAQDNPFVAFTMTLAIVIGFFATAGAHGSGLSQGFDYADVIHSIGGVIGTAMFFLFAIASIPPTCFCAFIAGNSFSTMIPGVPRVASTMAGAAVGIVLAVTGVAANLIPFFNIVGASFGPICGAMAADYLLSGRRWAGPRAGINFAGYIAWAVGFVVGILPFLPLSAEVKTYVQPAVLYSFFAGFVVYALLAKAGLQPKAVSD